VSAHFGGLSGIAGQGSFRAAQQVDLPFGGVPEELSDRVEAELAREPEHEVTPPVFRQQPPECRPLTVWGLLAPQRAALGGAGALVLVETAATQAGPLLVQVGIDEGIVPGDLGLLATVCAAFFALTVVGWLAGWARARLTARIGEGSLERLRRRVFAHLQRLSIDYYEREPAGRIISRMTSDVEALTQLFHEGLVQFVAQTLVIVVVTVALFVLDPALAALTLLVVLPVMGVLTVWFRNRSHGAYRRVRDRIADVVAHLAENLAGVRVVTAHNRHWHNLAEHRNVVGTYRDANNETARLAAAYSGGSEFVAIGGQAFILAVGGSMVMRGTLSVGVLAAFVLYLTHLFSPIQQLVQVYNAYQRGQAGMAYLRALLATRPSVPEAPDAVDLPRLDGDIAFAGVSFAYGDGPPVLHDVDLRVAPGETLALVGPTGAGKSTIVKLLARLSDPVAGSVRVDGRDLRDVTFASLRRQLGTVPQEPFLFAGTLRDNIAFARPEASDDEVWQACRAVGLGPLVDRLPGGLDAPCHERGVTLSAGERQLIALARAFLARPRLLILDEATSNLDLASEARVERALDTLLEGRTAILIAHRLATAMRADRIAVVHDGRIVELGTHDALVRAGGRYARLHAAWRGTGGATAARWRRGRTCCASSELY